MARETRLVYITTLGHTGSTLLDLLISAHSQAATVGSLVHLPRFPAVPCTCGAPDLTACTYWSAVDADLRATGSGGLTAADLATDDDPAASGKISRLYETLARVADRPVIVESSKVPDRLARLLRADAVRVFPIHLIRRPQGVVYSQVRKGRPWLHNTLRYTKQVLETHALLRGVDHRVVRYEDLATDPEATLRPLMDWIGLEFEPRQLDWSAGPHHNLGGNRMKFSQESTIELDTDWQSRLPAWQKLAVSALTFPAAIVRS